MKASSVQSDECTTADSSSFVENSVLSDTLSEGNQTFGLTQSMSNLTVDNSDPRFQVSVDILFQINVTGHKNNKTKISYSSLGPQFDEWVCSRSVWAYAQSSSFLSNTRKIPRDIAARFDKIVLTGETETSLGSPEVSPGASNINPIGLPDLETICKKQIPTLRYIPVKFRFSWPDVLTKIIEGCFLGEIVSSAMPSVWTFFLFPCKYMPLTIKLEVFYTTINWGEVFVLHFQLIFWGTFSM